MDEGENLVSLRILWKRYIVALMTGSAIFWAFSDKVAKWEFRICPKMVSIMSYWGVYMVRAVKFRCNRRSTLKDPDF